MPIPVPLRGNKGLPALPGVELDLEGVLAEFRRVL